ncbi:DUF3298 and DUF4163 domain-containing protein [Pseudobutyrivibrio xylanivorans]|uniref:DUF3298 domain-containing protein n=1 Tax=Pseudobutyrivibrio xylanivorans DSM 14809 TaxID=1123012 RepID=A0A1M6LH57_PSEXY|nr:DUF3298 and DUF4163 domain-containing protein [Pseudobutyrivibrio xylanivorans]SHJ70534.1 hypothetical protein SAMN02745725_03106 [Pseudobutyrivibrio xylanivorans DSM 14809]
MKRTKLFLSLLCVALVATGCKGSVESPAVEDNSTKEDSQTTEVATQENSNFRPEIYSGKEYIFEEAYEDGVYSDAYVTGHYDMYKLSPETREAYPALNTAIEDSMNARKKKYDETHAEYLDSSKQLRESGEVSTFVLESDLFLRRADEKVISFVDQDTEYAAGAHGVTRYESYNFDVQSGKEILLADIVTDKEAFQSKLAQALTEKYGEDTFNDLEGNLEDLSLDNYEWAFDYNGITFYSNEFASYSAGVITANLPYDSAFLTQDFAINSNEGYISQIPLYYPDTTHIDIVDSLDEGISISPNYDPNNLDLFWIQSLNISKDGQTFTTDDLYVWDVEAYIIHMPDGTESLMLMTTGDNDYSCSYVYSLDGQIKLLSNDNFSHGMVCEGDDYGQIVPIDPEKVAFVSRFDLLATFGGTRNYSFESNGTFTSVDKYYKTSRTHQQDLVSKMELTVPVVDEAGEETGEEVTLPSGTHYSIIRTNGEDEVDCRIEDGRIIRFHLENPSGEGYIYDIEINGINAEDIFETLWYAG